MKHGLFIALFFVILGIIPVQAKSIELPFGMVLTVPDSWQISEIKKNEDGGGLFFLARKLNDQGDVIASARVERTECVNKITSRDLAAANTQEQMTMAAQLADVSWSNFEQQLSKAGIGGKIELGTPQIMKNNGYVCLFSPAMFIHDSGVDRVVALRFYGANYQSALFISVNASAKDEETKVEVSRVFRSFVPAPLGE